MAKKKKGLRYVTLGEKAASFYDPITKLKLTPGAVFPLTPKQAKSKLTADALRGGHLITTDKEAYEEYQELLEERASKNPKAAEETKTPAAPDNTGGGNDDDEEEDEDKVSLDDMPTNKGDIINWLVENSIELDMQKSQEELEEMNKPEVIEYAESLFDTEEE